MVTRCVEPELLDELPPDDPSALGSRRDILRLNAWMGHSRIMARALCQSFDTRLQAASADKDDNSSPGALPSERDEGGLRTSDGTTPAGCAISGNKGRARQLVELGAGDGRLLLRVAHRLSPAWHGTTAVLVDQHNAVSTETQQGFEALGWRAEVVEADVFDWLKRPTVGFCDAALANLFLHHFPGSQLTRLLAEAAHLTERFVAIEPQRAVWSLTCSHMVWMLGCNRVTQKDAPASVRAGFAGDELSRLWPAYGGWSLQERRVGWFSHLFTARRATDGNG